MYKHRGKKTMAGKLSDLLLLNDGRKVVWFAFESRRYFCNLTQVFAYQFW